MTIRKMSIRDYDPVAALWAGIPGLGVHLKEADSRGSIKRYLARNPGMSFVARHKGRILGAVLCGHDGRRGILYHLAVLPEYQRKGIARRLVEHCLKALKKAGIGKCYIFVFSNNTRAKSFWRRLGWSGYAGLDAMCRLVKPPVLHKRPSGR